MTDADRALPLAGECHCGAVRIELSQLPPWIIDCNCSICRRNGALWTILPPETVRVSGHPQHTSAYVWGAKTIRTLRCAHCGCVTHWEPLRADSDGRLGVNLRNFDPHMVGTLRVRRFDGAESWSYLDD